MLSASVRTTDPSQRICSVEGCENNRLARGVCKKHYHKLMRYGTPTPYVPTLAERFWASIDVAGPEDCWNSRRWRRGKGGHRGFSVQGHDVYAHRFAWELAHGPIPKGLEVCHRCDNGACCNPAHLFLGTQADNVADMHAKGRGNTGSRNGAAKLREEDVREIRALYAAGELQRVIAGRFGVGRPTISMIVNRRHWRSI